MIKEIQIKSLERIKKHGEVLTASKEVEAMLRLVQEEFKNPNKTFLEPACGNGNFLTAILERKLANILFEKNTRLFKESILFAIKSVYGMDLLEDNINTAKERLFTTACEYYYNITGIKPEKDFSDKIKEILSENIKKADFLQSDEYNNMHFNVILGNPPYQEIDGGGTGDSAKPIYQFFIQKAKKLNPDFIVMIIPSRWMKGGKGLGKFRQEMINDKRIHTIYDFENAQICFPNVHIDGGVCYFLWAKEYNGPVEYHYLSFNGKENISKRFLKNSYTNTVIRDERQISVIEKTASLNETKFSSIVFSRNPYGLYADLFNSPEKYPNVKIYDEPDEKLYKVYGVKGKKGGAIRISKYINPPAIEKNKDEALKYKLFFSKAYTTTSTVPPEIIIGKPQEVCTETFLQIGSFETEKEALNCLKYIKTKFFRALLFFNRHSLNISKESFNMIPIQDFTQEWSDEKLYKMYNLQNELEFIDSVIKPMY